ncbi:MAG TPA: VOC family protein [Hyphomonas sp.]|nr:VOC family protein [Hyphomonas sp.]HRJ48649.1 VOC family protein [Opitutaceae bacterium]
MHALHHLSFATNDLPRAAAFYDAALGALGYRQVCASGGFVGYGTEDNCDKFALKRQKAPICVPRAGFHLAFAAPNRKAVDAFYEAAMKQGGKNNGGCGLHKEYGPNYYAAFVFDPDGYRIEAVINGPE